MSACDEIQPLVSALADGELDGDEEKRVRAHLETCAVCCALLAELAATSALVAKHAERPRMDELSWARFEQALEREPARSNVLRGA
jgi:anti-sigma factor RsiW